MATKKVNLKNKPVIVFNKKAIYEAPSVTLTIENTTNKDRVAVLFGMSMTWFRKNFGSDQGIKITPDNGVEYSQLLFESGFQPFRIGLIRFQGNDKKDIQSIPKFFTGYSFNGSGQSLTDPCNKLVESKWEGTFLNTNPFDITCNTCIWFTVKAKSKIFVSYFAIKQVNSARSLSDNPIVTKYAMPTGLFHKESKQSKDKNFMQYNHEGNFGDHYYPEFLKSKSSTKTKKTK